MELIVRNGIRNALEATRLLAPTDPASHPIVVSWGPSDVEYRVAVRDHAAGLPAAHDRAFEIGVSNKDDHLGMGLAIAQRAAITLGGRLILRPAEGIGAVFEFRWTQNESAART